MDNSVYQTPESEIKNKHDRQGSPVKAVVVATLVDIGGTMIFGILYVMAYWYYLESSGFSAEQIEKALAFDDLTSTISLIGIVGGGLISLYSGYLCAKIVNYDEFRVVTYYACVMIVFNFLLTEEDTSITQDIILNVITLMCIYVGAWLYVRKSKKETNESRHVF